MLYVKPTTHFKKAIKKLSKPDLLAVDEVLQMLVARKPLPAKYRPHLLQGIFGGFTECHIKPDLLLIYYVKEDTLYLMELGSHSDLFG